MSGGRDGRSINSPTSSRIAVTSSITTVNRSIDDHLPHTMKGNGHHNASMNHKVVSVSVRNAPPSSAYDQQGGISYHRLSAGSDEDLASSSVSRCTCTCDYECMKRTSISAVSHARVHTIVTRVSIIFCMIHIAMACIGSFHYHNFDVTYTPLLILICGYGVGILSSFTNECTEPRRILSAQLFFFFTMILLLVIPTTCAIFMYRRNVLYNDDNDRLIASIVSPTWCTIAFMMTLILFRIAGFACLLYEPVRERVMIKAGVEETPLIEEFGPPVTSLSTIALRLHRRCDWLSCMDRCFVGKRQWWIDSDTSVSWCTFAMIILPLLAILTIAVATDWIHIQRNDTWHDVVVICQTVYRHMSVLAACW